MFPHILFCLIIRSKKRSLHRQYQIKLRDVNDTAESDFLLQKIEVPINNFEFLLRKKWTRGANYTAESDSAEFDSTLSMKPLNLTPRCQLHRRDYHSCVNDTAETTTAVSMTPQKFCTSTKVNQKSKVFIIWILNNLSHKVIEKNRGK